MANENRINQTVLLVASYFLSYTLIISPFYNHFVLEQPGILDFDLSDRKQYMYDKLDEKFYAAVRSFGFVLLVVPTCIICHHVRIIRKAHVIKKKEDLAEKFKQRYNLKAITALLPGIKLQKTEIDIEQNIDTEAKTPAPRQYDQEKEDLKNEID